MSHCTDGYRSTPVGEIRKRKREHKKRRAIFALLWISRDYSDHERVQHYVHDDDVLAYVLPLGLII